MDKDEQQSKPSNEIVKLILNSKTLLLTTTTTTMSNSVHVERIYMYEAETQTLSTNEITDLLSKEAGDEARLTGSNKYGVLSLDEYQITRTGEEHCLKKYFSDDDISLSDEEINVDKQMEQMNLDEKGDRTVLIENINNNASTILRPSHSNLSNTLIFDETTHLSATLAQSTSSRISQSRYLQTFKEDDEIIDDDDDDELDQLVASTFSPTIENEDKFPCSSSRTNEKSLSSIRWFVRQAIDSCRQNLTLVDQLLENLPSSPSTYEHILQRKIHRTNCILSIPNALKGLQYYPSASVQTE